MFNTMLHRTSLEQIKKSAAAPFSMSKKQVEKLFFIPDYCTIKILFLISVATADETNTHMNRTYKLYQRTVG